MDTLEKIKDKNIRFWYANEAANGNWSEVVLNHQIELNLYERKVLIDKKNNFKNTLVDPLSDLVNDLQKVVLEMFKRELYLELLLIENSGKLSTVFFFFKIS